MDGIIHFFEYSISGWWYFFYFIIMVTLGFACLGVVGDKKSKQKHAEKLIRREAIAREEFERAQKLISNQTTYSGDTYNLDPLAQDNNKKEEPKVNIETENNEGEGLSSSQRRTGVLILDEPVFYGDEGTVGQEKENNAEIQNLNSEITTNVENNDETKETIVDNTDEDAINNSEVPDVLVIDEK